MARTIKRVRFRFLLERRFSLRFCTSKTLHLCLENARGYLLTICPTSGEGKHDSGYED